MPWRVSDFVSMETAALTDGHELDGWDLTDASPGGVDHLSGMEWQPTPQEAFAALAGGDEADVLAVGLGRRPQPELGRQRPHLGLG